MRFKISDTFSAQWRMHGINHNTCFCHLFHFYIVHILQIFKSSSTLEGSTSNQPADLICKCPWAADYTAFLKTAYRGLYLLKTPRQRLCTEGHTRVIIVVLCEKKI